jgi:methionine-S-sulfoxide reductase
MSELDNEFGCNMTFHTAVINDKQPSESDSAEIYFAGGCFWDVEKYLSCIKGVITTEVGYANGNTEDPSYEDVCYNETGHAETVKVIYNKSVLPLEKLLALYYEIIDPTSINRQGHDFGEQYRTGIYYTDIDDEAVIRDSIVALQKREQKPVVIEVEPLKNYYPAESYHQKYLDKNPNGYCHISKSKIEKTKML